ncbi:MAG: hypothetical protein QXK78_04475 [Candidatus Bathyarchaeia archaeon]
MSVRTSPLKSILKRACKAIKESHMLRERFHEDMRKVTSLSKQSILQIHRNQLIEAASLLGEAGEVISKLNILSKDYPDIIYGGLFSIALQEYAEARILLHLVTENTFVAPEEIGVPFPEYLLGLADVIGECRRLVLEALRDGNMEKSEFFLKVMEEIYIELLALGDAYMLVPELRRKCDVARRIIEATRGDVILEVRRLRLEKLLEHIEEASKRALR